ncbi:MAG: hypothetical protein V7744_19975 [Pseudomonadales bacterium]
MKFFVLAVLIALNLVIFLAEHPQFDQNVVMSNAENTRPLALLHEVDKPVLRSSSMELSVGDSLSTSTEKCVALGPLEENQSTDIVALFEENDTPFQLRKNLNEVDRAWLVYIGPFPDKNAIKEERRRLRKLGLDSYLLDDMTVSLGVFGARDNSLDYVSVLQAKGLDPQIKSIKGMQESIFIQVAMGDYTSLAAKINFRQDFPQEMENCVLI